MTEPEKKSDPEVLTDLRHDLAALRGQYSALQGENQQLKWQVEQLKKQLFGPSSDRAKLAETYVTEQALLSMFPPPAEPALRSLSVFSTFCVGARSDFQRVPQ